MYVPIVGKGRGRELAGRAQQSKKSQLEPRPGLWEMHVLARTCWVLRVLAYLS